MASTMVRIGVAASIGVAIGAAAGATGGGALIAAGALAALSAVGEEAIVRGVTKASSHAKKYFSSSAEHAETPNSSIEGAVPTKEKAVTPDIGNNITPPERSFSDMVKASKEAGKTGNTLSH